ncbi:FAD-linked oxidase C-terminal domain-containing protein [Burkholderia oklahomensis]|uniref:FAD-linked oxidase C-terminal domain-containing protein n=3 Tax=Burkholderia oklahomensis TaxID=342113 RepID=UPI0005D7DDD5|nr:FAD-linked oxidase C-terminal domain-containing protein [Burkholderia oklahomensis]AJX34431.1 FAD binding domain protein [Burkholderia oklahomensis C6786]AOI48789.1 glycolate oxidase [Burkholderia oklahomensis C6786]KUY50608.1 glycolate oxidase [Burkholderia oklahomensis C6786]MBI0363018.1 FAD-binding protein [Burkholderia oklahomensis]SUY27118.1 Uncharacterized FAD-linked oxidoreductase Rv2280 [Burkholderia oklahomensis]
MREVTDDEPQLGGWAAFPGGAPSGDGAPAAFATPETVGRCVEALRAIVGERLVVGRAVREQHGKDVSFHPGAPPDAVAFVQSTAEVAAITRACHRLRVPLIPFGAGTSCEGHIAALHGGVCIDLSGMNRILRVSAEDLDCTVEAGVTRKQLNAHLHDTGLFFPIDPGADASIGGMCSTRASGTNAVRYGTMRESVLALEVVLPNGDITSVGSRARKSAAGYDLARLFVGAEGTLGTITGVTLRLHPRPDKVSAAVCGFPDLKAAVDSVIGIVQSGIPVARVELLDAMQIVACNRYSKLSLPERPTLFFEFSGFGVAVDEQVGWVEEICADHGGGEFRWASRPEERSALWAARHDVWWASLALRPGCEGMPTDSCVPVSRLTEAVLAARADVDALSLVATICGHVGDGNFHVCIVIDPTDAEELMRATELNRRLALRAIALGGTCTGEHGIGYGKIGYLEREHPTSLRLMAAVKRALDPRGIMNPGKVLRHDRYPPFD